MKEVYDAVIIGSGLGGLVSANILAKEGYSVCVLEKNKQHGGNLQIFVRNKTIFDTGVHYIGGLDKGQNLYKYFKYLEIIDDLNLKKLDKDGFDIITFNGDSTEYKYAQGYDNFIKTLLKEFPEEENAITTYCDKMKEVCNSFPLYRLKNKNFNYYSNLLKNFQLQAKGFIQSLTKNKKLRAVLAGTNFLYAGEGNRTPFYVHALSVNTYIESSYRCVNGGNQITKVLIHKLRQHGGEIYNYHEVIKFSFSDGKISSVLCKNGKKIKGKLFISNMDIKIMLKLIGEDKFKKSYVKKINSRESIISAFSLYLVLKPKTFKYLNKNYYHFRDYKMIWNGQDYTEESWPESYYLSMGIRKNNEEWGENLTALTYMNYDDVKSWEKTFNTVAEINERGQTYNEFKAEKAEKFLDLIEIKFPNIRSCIQEIYTSTPLTYRDYIGNNRGSMYGYVKDINNPLASLISPKTKIKNLFSTGQSLYMHGILGVTIGAVLTCSSILGKDYLVDKILEANKVKANDI